MGWVDVDWIQLAQARNQSRAVVDRVVTIWFLKIAGSS
jgi:hypothetical protein